MSLLERLAKDLKEAIRSRHEPRKSAIRMITWAAKNAQVEKGDPLSDGELVTLIAKEVRHCQESIAGFNKGGRDDLAAKEQAELEVLQSYMPPQMSQDEIAEEACKIIAEVGARGIAEGIAESLKDARLSKFREGGFHIVRAGGSAGMFSAIIAGWAASGSIGSTMVTREITR